MQHRIARPIHFHDAMERCSGSGSSSCSVLALASGAISSEANGRELRNEGKAIRKIMKQESPQNIKHLVEPGHKLTSRALRDLNPSRKAGKPAC
jgi:hypothetical protein